MSDQSLLARFKSRMSKLLGTPESSERPHRAPGVGTGVTRSNIVPTRETGSFESEARESSTDRSRRESRSRTSRDDASRDDASRDERSSVPTGITVHRPKPSVPSRAGASSRDERADRPAPARLERAPRADRPERGDRPERTPRAERMPRAEPVERAERVPVLDRAEALDRPARPPRADRPPASSAALATLDQRPEDTGDESRGRRRRRRRRTTGERLGEFDTDTLGTSREAADDFATPAELSAAVATVARAPRPTPPASAPDVLGALLEAIARQLANVPARNPEESSVNWNKPTSELTAQDWKTILVTAMQEASTLTAPRPTNGERPERPERAPRLPREDRPRREATEGIEAAPVATVEPRRPSIDEPEFVDETRPPAREPREPREPREHRTPRPAAPVETPVVLGEIAEPHIVSHSANEHAAPMAVPVAEPASDLLSELAPTPPIVAATPAPVQTPIDAAPVSYGRVAKPARRR